ncbi:hypothetical protein [Parendozoicomonas haliclonae]|uniref:Uncharacterized protein n=1 Tax=Parendozoicomonas haliclonae TaxID=1960125 RepID=A0A1X7AIP1_9GAMM|nr:hypothetical protein [Parendozoicomonas haliclonae]SMA44298.1 hypothetical protein EHSB41UT_01772 [Parendozoicomonas haliclonae]
MNKVARMLLLGAAVIYVPYMSADTSLDTALMNGLKRVEKQYTMLVQSASEKCDSLAIKSNPNTFEEMLCSNKPFPSIAARYCLYQNLMSPGSNAEFKASYTATQTDSGVITTETNKQNVTMTYDCSNLVTPVM